MKIYRVQYHTGDWGDTGIEVKWLPSKTKVRQFVQAELRGPSDAEEFEDLLKKGFRTHELKPQSTPWAVDEVDVPTTKDKMIDFLNRIADWTKEE